MPGDIDFDGRVTGADFCAAVLLVGSTLDDTEQRTSDNETPDDPNDDFVYDAWKFEGRAFNGLHVTINANPGDGAAATLADAGVIRGLACMGDFNGDGVANTQDVLAYLNSWNNQDPCADINLDGTVNTVDFLAFLNLWTGGC